MWAQTDRQEEEEERLASFVPFEKKNFFQLFLAAPPQDLRILVPMPPSVKVPGLNHWIDREIPTLKSSIHLFF